MNSVNFDDANRTLAPPEGRDDVNPLRVAMTEYSDGQPVTISCWEPTPAEMAELKRTGKIWLHVSGHGMPPVMLRTDHPFVRPDTERDPSEGFAIPSHCMAVGCERDTGHDHVMCARHWALVPYRLQVEVSIEHQPGQMEPGGPKPTPAWFGAMAAAIRAVRQVERSEYGQR